MTSLIFAYLVFRLDLGEEVGVRYSSMPLEVGQIVETNYAGHRCFEVKEIRPLGFFSVEAVSAVRGKVFVDKVPCE